MITENLSTLKIHKMSKEQYEREYLNGQIDPTAIYLTPDSCKNFVAGDNITIIETDTEITISATAMGGLGPDDVVNGGTW